MHFRTHVKDGTARHLRARMNMPTAWSSTTCTSASSSNCSTNSASPITPSCIYSTDNGPHMNTWPDAAMTPFRGEKNTNWEGGWRVPAMVRWPGKIKAGSVTNEIVHHMDWLPTFVAAAGDTDIKERPAEGHKSGRSAASTRCISMATTSCHYLTGQRRPRPAQGDLLLLGRRRPDGAALRRLEDDLHGAAGRRRPCRPGRSPSCRCACR